MVKLSDRIADAWNALVGRPTRGERASHAQVLALQREVAELRLEMAELARTATEQRSRLEETESFSRQADHDPLEGFYRDLAAPLAQLRLQRHLMENGKEMSSRSVMALARQLIDRLEAGGLEELGPEESSVPFDPAWCKPLAAGTAFEPGEAVVITVVGYRYRGTIIRKALVSASDSRQDS